MCLVFRQTYSQCMSRHHHAWVQGRWQAQPWLICRPFTLRSTTQQICAESHRHSATRGCMTLQRTTYLSIRNCTSLVCFQRPRGVVCRPADVALMQIIRGRSVAKLPRAFPQTSFTACDVQRYRLLTCLLLILLFLSAGCLPLLWRAGD